MTKFRFEINSRDGYKLPPIQITGINMTDAEGKLRRMYRHCEIIEAKEIEPPMHSPVVPNFVGLLDLISQ